MQRLNIPLKRHSKTTRPLGQVVWLMALSLLVCAFVVFRMATLWFSRGTILQLGPVNTVMAVELHINAQTAPFLQEWLFGVPLISDRSIILNDLIPFIEGEMAIFINVSGDRSVAIRASKENLPTELLNQSGISVQEKNGFLLLSSSLSPINGVKPLVRRPLLPTLRNTWLGRVVFPDEKLAGNLMLKESELLLETKTHRTKYSSKTSVNFPVSLDRLSWGEEGSPLDGLERIFDGLLEESETSLILGNSQMEVVLRSDDEVQEILLILKDLQTNPEEIVRELERIGALARPSVNTQILPDGSKLEEILDQPELVSIEEISTGLGLSYRVLTNNGQSILAAISEGSILFSNSQKLMEDYAQNSTEPIDRTCILSKNHIEPSFLLENIYIDSANRELSILSQVFKQFSSVSIEVNKYSTLVHLCRI